MEKKEIARLEQKKFGKIKQTFLLYDDGTLFISLTNKGNIQEFSAKLTGWDPEPAHNKGSTKGTLLFGCLCLGLVCAGIASVALWANVLSTEILTPIWMGILFCPVFGWWSLDKYHREKYDVLVFCNPTTNSQLVLFYDKPNKEAFDSFVAALKNTLTKFQNVIPNAAQALTADLREFARLRDDGIMSNEEFEETKRKLLATLDSPSGIGFHSR